MSQSCDRQGRGAGAIFFVAAILVSMSASAQEPPATNQTLDDCQLIPDDGARLACYDRVIKAGRANVVSPSAGSAGPSGGGASGGSVATAPKTPEQVRAEREQEFGLPEHETEAVRAERGETVDEITVEVADTRIISGGKLRFIMTNGMVWDQTEGAPPQPPKPGTEVTIRENFMGGHICKLNQWTSVRCARVE